MGFKKELSFFLSSFLFPPVSLSAKKCPSGFFFYSSSHTYCKIFFVFLTEQGDDVMLPKHSSFVV